MIFFPIAFAHSRMYLSRELSACKKTAASKDKELQEATQSTAQSMRAEVVAALEEAKRASELEQDQLLAQVQDVQDKLRQAQEDHSR